MEEIERVPSDPQSVLAKAAALAIQWEIPCWRVVQRILLQRRTSQVVAILWKTDEEDGVARIVDAFAPHGIFIPFGDRKYVDTSPLRLLWNLAPNEIRCGTEPLRHGSLNGRFESAATGMNKRNTAIQVLVLDEVHTRRAARWLASHAPPPL